MKKNIDNSDFKRVAIEATLAGGEVVKKYFRGATNLHSEKKDKSAIITLADIEAEKEMRFIIENYFPTHSIIGEELEDKIQENEYKWILDPIDGTSNFVMGKPIFGILVSLFKNNKPVLGIIYQPILNEMFVAIEGEKTFLNGNPINTSKTNELRKSLVATNPPYMFETQNEKHILWELHKNVRAIEFGGDCYNYAMLANGYIDIVLICRDDFHDYAAVISIVKGAGGIITDWEGQELTPLSTGHIIATANKKLHTAVLKRIKCSNSTVM